MATRLVVGTFTPSVLLRTARRLGRLAEHDLEVEEVPVPSSPAQFRSLLAGELDIAVTSPDNVVAYRFVPDNPLGATADVSIVAAVDKGLGLALYGRPGVNRPEQLRGATLGVDVPTSGFALAMYAAAESLGVARDEYDLAALGSTPKRLQALLAGECDATVLGAGNELLAEQAGCVALARIADVCAPYLGTVLSVTADQPATREFAAALRRTADTIVAGAASGIAADEARSALGLPDELANYYVERMRSTTEGLVPGGTVDPRALATIVELRSRYLGGSAALDSAVEPSSGLVLGPPGTR